MLRTPQIASRLSCFAIISAIEDDLRDAAKDLAGTLSQNFLSADVREKALKRREENSKDLPQMAEPIQEDVELLPYTDFGDLAQVLRQAAKQMMVEKQNQMVALATQLEKLVPCRNRVCHSRPLEPEDYPSLMDLAQSLSQNQPLLPMSRCAATVNRLVEDPAHVLQLEIPNFWAVDVSEIHHNLPLPEFDDTGFLGRTKDRRELAKLLASPHPVVTIVGEGGVGKTALAMRCLYDIVQDPQKTDYDAIIWVSLKSQILTVGGAKEISGAITDVLGVISNIACQLGVPGPQQKPSVDALIQEIASYMREFRILLAIDNIETLAKDTLRPLLSAIPRTSKVLLTSRIGLGEIELRYPLDPLDQATAVVLLRRQAAHLNLSILTKLAEDSAIRLCNAVFNNPLLIKWFVSAVAGGMDPQSILSKSSPSYLSSVSFCFENLFNRLTNEEKHLIHVLASVRKPLSQAELVYLAKDLTKDQLEWALSTLLYSSMLRRSFSSDNSSSPTTYYSLTEIASEYVSKIAPPPAEIFKAVQASLRDLRLMVQDDLVAQATYPFQIFSIHARSRDEIICAAYLKRAVKVRDKDSDAALKYVNDAKAILPSYAENYRIAAIIETLKNDVYRADQEYKLALDLAPDSPIVNYTYGRFLLRYLDDAGQALERFKEAARLVPNDVAPLTSMALCLMRLGECKEAAQLYDKVLKECISQPRKWRLSARDQAAECYRRWMEQDRLMRDNAALREHLIYSLEILKDAFKANDYDEKTAERLERVLELGIRSIIEFGDEQGAEVIAQSLRETWVVIESSETARRVVDRFRETFAELALEDYKTLSDISRQHFANWTSETNKNQVRVKKREWTHGEEATGEIKSIVSDKNYGFIKTPEGRDWFFHRSSVQPSSLWNRLAVGVDVKFRVGENSSGICATNIQLLNSVEE